MSRQSLPTSALFLQHYFTVLQQYARWLPNARRDLQEWPLAAMHIANLVDSLAHFLESLGCDAPLNRLEEAAEALETRAPTPAHALATLRQVRNAVQLDAADSRMQLFSLVALVFGACERIARDWDTDRAQLHHEDEWEMLGEVLADLIDETLVPQAAAVH